MPQLTVLLLDLADSLADLYAVLPIDSSVSTDGSLPLLHRAVRSGSLATVSSLLQRGQQHGTELQVGFIF